MNPDPFSEPIQDLFPNRKHNEKLEQQKFYEEKKLEQYEKWQKKNIVWNRTLVISTIVMSIATFIMAITNVILMVKK